MQVKTSSFSNLCFIMTQKHRECDDMADLYEKITEGAYDEGNFRTMTSSDRF